MAGSMAQKYLNRNQSNRRAFPQGQSCQRYTINRSWHCVRPRDLAEHGESARKHELHYHMDGARFANAMALQVAPSEVTWKEALTFCVSEEPRMRRR